MEMSEIRREKLAVTQVGTLDSSIAEQAAEVLGYDAQTSKAQYAAHIELPRLKAALAKLEIDILNRADVERYKLQVLHAAQVRQLALEPERHPFAYWNDVAISQYRKPIPDFVLNKAIQIKREIPECEIVIVELNENPDPFLLCKIGYQEEYYVEVWDEPGFEK